MKIYDTTIGLEIHVELATQTKIFCGCATKFGAKPNTQICPVCTGMPGTLPVLNKKVVENAIAVGLATNCNITKATRFDRKNYFYPDNPQNYQISQLYKPICKNGYIKCTVGDKEKKFGIHEIHMEEDAGKLIHDESRGISLIDYNRAGVPLIEIVTEPDMENSEDVLSFLDELKDIIKYLGVSDCKLNEGSMRVDVNLSIKEAGSKELGVRTEMKNLNSFKAIARAIDHERERQIAILERGKSVDRETRRWDDTVGCSYSMRSKEDVNDYRYFPEPDLQIIRVSDEWIESIKTSRPELRSEKKARYRMVYGLPEYDIDVLTEHSNIASIFEGLQEYKVQPKKASNWIMVDVFKIVNDHNDDITNLHISIEQMAELIHMVESKKITKASGIQVLEALYEEDIDVKGYVEQNNLLIVEDKVLLSKVIEDVFVNNPQSIEDYKAGKTKAMGYLVGQTMKAMKGKASPELVNRYIKEKLEEL